MKYLQFILLQLKLLQIVKLALPRHQLVEGADLDDTAMLHDDDAVSVANRRQTVGNDKRCPPLLKPLFRQAEAVPSAIPFPQSAQIQLGMQQTARIRITVLPWPNAPKGTGTKSGNFYTEVALFHDGGFPSPITPMTCPSFCLICTLYSRMLDYHLARLLQCTFCSRRTYSRTSRLPYRRICEQAFSYASIRACRRASIARWTSSQIKKSGRASKRAQKHTSPRSRDPIHSPGLSTPGTAALRQGAASPSGSIDPRYARAGALPHGGQAAP
ncbi:hypothetical protein PAAL109150_20900 [Paenibacillus alkaliterrae]